VNDEKGFNMRRSETRALSAEGIAWAKVLK
jgi:hypothetical protein